MRNFKTLGRLSLCTLSLLLTLGSCKKDEEKPNQPPTPAELLTPKTAEQLTAPSEIRFSWKKSTDPEGDPIVYDLYWATKGEKDFSLLKANISTNDYVLNKKLTEDEYRWKIVAKNTQNGGGKTESKVSNFIVKIPELTFSGENQIQLLENTATSITINSGTGNYTATVKDPNLAEATIKDGKLVITPKLGGTTQITLTDTKTQKSKILFITIIPHLSITPQTAQLVIGESKTLAVKGSGKYQIESSNPSVAKALITTENQLIIEGKEEGSALLTIKDLTTSESQEVRVSVALPTDIKFSSFPVAVSITEESTEVRTLGFAIPKGYRVKSQNANIATASINSDGDIVIYGKSKGETQIQLIDVHNKIGINLNVKVYGKLTLSTDNITLDVGTDKVITIANGSGEYDFEIKGDKKADISITNSKLTLTGIRKGSFQIEIEDIRTNLKKTLTVNVTGVDNLAVALSQITLKAGEQKTVNITAGSGNYKAESNNANITVSVAGSVLTIYGVSEGTSQITVTDNQSHQTQTIAVTITGASAITLEGATIEGTVLKKMDDNRIPADGHITIPNGITKIEGGAFVSCYSLKSVTISNSVISIGGGAFSDCRNLTSVTLSNSIKSIGRYAFNQCKELTSITIPNSVTSIGDNAFKECDKLTSVIIPNSVTSIEEGTFAFCKSLTSVVIPNSVTSIGDNAFLICSSLTSVAIPNSVKSIGNSAFNRCTNLTSVVIPNSVTSIGEYAFMECASLTSVTLSNSLKSIGRAAFYKCASLTSVTIPNSVTSIGVYAFRECTSLTSVTILNSVMSIGVYAFQGCTSLTSVTCLATTPPTSDSTVFVDTPITTIHVPSGLGNTYKSAEGWKNYTIVEQ